MVHKSKTRSKRKTLRQKYGQEKAKKAHAIRIEKALKANPALRPKRKRDPGIPNLFPLKDKLLEAAERRKDRLEDEALARREKKRAETLRLRREKLAAKSRAASESADGSGFAGVAARAAAAAGDVDERQAASSGAQRRRGWYMKELRRTLEESDVLLEVLDARDPIGCRCPAVERLVTGRLSNAHGGKPKRIILVLNKIDLVPPEVAAQWVDYLRADFPCVAFKASTQQQSAKLGQSYTPSLAAVSAAAAGSAGAGAGKLAQLLKSFASAGGVKTHITVGVIGYPNVGKSSIINTLKRSRAVGVGAAPGFTKEVTSIKLDRNVTLLDSPGVLFSSGDEADPGLVLRNALRVEDVEDPVGAVAVMLRKCPAADLMALYRLPAFASCDEFLYHVARQRGKLRRGGVPDLEAAARLVLQDWNKGAIQYYTSPPASRRPHAEETTDGAAASDARVVDSWAPDFDIDSIIREHNDAALAAPPAGARGRGGAQPAYMEVVPSAPPGFSWEDDGDDGADDGPGGMAVDEIGASVADEDEEAAAAAGQYMLRPAKGGGRKGGDNDDPDSHKFSATDANNVQIVAERKKEQKRLRKQREKQARRAKSSSSSRGGSDDDGDAMADESGPPPAAADDAYDFDTDWQD